MNSFRSTRLRAWVVLIIILIFGGLLWTYGPLKQFLNQESLQRLANYLSTFSHPLLMVIIAYMIASVVLFPVTAMVVVTGLTLPPTEALLAGSLGVLASSATGFGIGYLLGPERVERYLGGLYGSVRNLVRKNVFISVIAIRHLPLGPFTFVNTVLGSMHLNLVGYLLANGVSLLPTLIGSILVKQGIASFS